MSHKVLQVIRMAQTLSKPLTLEFLQLRETKPVSEYIIYDNVRNTTYNSVQAFLNAVLQ